MKNYLQQSYWWLTVYTLHVYTKCKIELAMIKAAKFMFWFCQSFSQLHAPIISKSLVELESNFRSWALVTHPCQKQITAKCLQMLSANDVALQSV